MGQTACRKGCFVQRVQFTFSSDVNLTYGLNDSKTARLWCDMLSQMQPSYLQRNVVNHRHGFANVDEIGRCVDRLKKSLAVLGLQLPEPIHKGNWHSVLNALHVNFPEFFKVNFDHSKFQAAHEMNLLIHWLEYELVNLYEDKEKYLFNLDFNHYPPAYNLKTDFPEDEYGYFSPDLQFGNLHLHYIFIGRHFLEMFDAQDFVSPAHHFVAQHAFNATCGLVFSEPQDQTKTDSDMREYFARRGGNQFFKHRYDHPKLAKGFFKLGQLQALEAYATKPSRTALRDAIQRSSITAWKFL
jgi:hypothetical protein